MCLNRLQERSLSWLLLLLLLASLSLERLLRLAGLLVLLQV